MSIEPEATVIAAIIGFLAALLPKLYDSIIAKKKQRFDYATALAEQLTAEGQELRKELRKEIEILRQEIAQLREENEEIKEENLKLKTRISQLELELDRARGEDDV
jgi:uncharacterized protein YicC (UPF0701 family)